MTFSIIDFSIYFPYHKTVPCNNCWYLCVHSASTVCAPQHHNTSLISLPKHVAYTQYSEFNNYVLKSTQTYYVLKKIMCFGKCLGISHLCVFSLPVLGLGSLLISIKKKQNFIQEKVTRSNKIILWFCVYLILTAENNLYWRGFSRNHDFMWQQWHFSQ